MNARLGLPRWVRWGVVALGLALAAAPVWGGTAQRSAWLHVSVADDGSADAALVLDARPLASAGMVRALRQVLGSGAAVERPFRSGPGGWGVLAHGGEHFRRRGVVVAGRLDLAPLQQELERMGVASLSVNLRHYASGVSRCTGAERQGSLEGYEAHYSLVTPVAAAPRSIRLEFGYPPAELLRIFGPMALPFLLPVLITLVLRRRALRDGVNDPAGAWFRYNRTLQWVFLGAILGGFSALFGFPAEAFFTFALPNLSEPVPGILNVLGPLLAPLLAAILCSVLSHPVAQRLRGVEATRRDVTRQALWTLALSVLCGLLVSTAIWKSTTDLRSGALWFLATIVTGGLGTWLIRRAAGTTLQPITSGELYDRIVALAEQAGVKLNAVYLMPARKGRLANAFAAAGGQVALSDYLLQHLTRREVDAVVAHELTHLKRRDPLRLLLAILLAIALPVAFLIVLDLLLGSRLEPFAFATPLALPCGLPIYYLVSRRCERAADAGALALTGDAEALITALAKSTHLNTLPLYWGKWDERLITHPSTMRRAEAIAARAGLTTERLQEILHDLDTDAGRYAPEVSSAPEARTLYALYKGQIPGPYAWANLAVTVLTPAAVAAMARVSEREGVTRGAVHFLAFVITFALTFAVSTGVMAWGCAGLRRRLRARLEAEGVPVTAAGGAFVGFAPAACPRLYDGFSDWDVGFLVVVGGRLCYVGEEARFALHPEQVTEVRLGAGHPAWWRTRRVCVTWRDPTRGEGGTFSLHPADAHALWSGRAMPALVKALRRWRDAPSAPTTLPTALVDLDAPALGEIPSTSPHSTATFTGMIVFLLEPALFALGAAWLFNLSLAPSGSGDGWGAALVSALVRLFGWLPSWRYREIVADADVPTDHTDR